MTPRARQLFVAVAVAVAVAFAASSSARAADSLTVTAISSADGTHMSVSASGTVDPVPPPETGSVVVEVLPHFDGADAQPSCITPTFGDVKASAPPNGGAVSVSAALPTRAGDVYDVCAYVTIATDPTLGLGYPRYTTGIVARAAIPPLGHEPVCPAGTVAALDLDVPAAVAYGREGTVSVVATHAAIVDAGGLAMLSAGSLKPFYADRFTPDDLGRINDDTGIDYSTSLDRGDPATNVVLDWTQDDGDMGAQPKCRMLLGKQVKPTPGTSAIARTRAGTISFRLPHAGCVVTKIERATIAVGAIRLTLADACGKWRAHGDLAGVRLHTKSGAGSRSASLLFAANRHLKANRSWRLTVRMGKRNLRRRLVARYAHRPDRQIFVGTDDFVNYCIDENQTIYSYHGRLYCWKYGYTHRSVAIR